jgi:hypothetical protein
MNNKYFSVVNDYTRLNTDGQEKPGQYLNILLLVIIPMAVFIVFIPLIVVQLDKQDYKTLEEDKFYGLSDEMYSNLQKRTNL